MGRRLPIAAGFCIGLGTAGLLNPTAYSRIAHGLRIGIPAIATQLAAPKQPTSPRLAPSFSATPSLSTYSCAANGFSESVQATGLDLVSRGHFPSKSVSLLNHVPTLQKRLDWYSMTRNAAIANAPRVPVPKPATIEWHKRSPEPTGFANTCVGASDTIARSQSSLGLMSLGSTSINQLTQAKRSLLQQQSHFILSLVTLTQESDWLLKPAPQASPVVHQMWISHEQVVSSSEP